VRKCPRPGVLPGVVEPRCRPREAEPPAMEQFFELDAAWNLSEYEWDAQRLQLRKHGGGGGRERQSNEMIRRAFCWRQRAAGRRLCAGGRVLPSGSTWRGCPARAGEPECTYTETEDELPRQRTCKVRGLLPKNLA
jgi:hypothetical protein